MICTTSRWVPATRALLCSVVALLPLAATVGAQEPEPIPFEAELGTVDEVGVDESIDSCLTCLDAPSSPRFSKYALDRVPVSVFELDSAMPVSNTRLRFDNGYDWQRPDRVEYFWARIGGKGPALNERSVDFQDLRLTMESGGGAVSVITDLAIRSIDPEVNPNTTGFGDMSIGLKSRLAKGDKWQVSSIFRTFILTGSASHGTGVGHVSMEPGLLGLYRPRPETAMHAELKYWFPLGADVNQAGQILRWGLGVSQIVWEHPCKRLALVPTGELIGWHVLDGLQTSPAGVAESVDDIFILNMQGGARLLIGESADLGLSGAFAITGDSWYETLLRLDLRFGF